MTASIDLLRVRVASRCDETPDICSLELQLPDGGMLLPFSAGAHIDVHLPGGFVRQYSLCNDERERHRYLIAVLLDPNSRGGSRAVHESVCEGDLLTIGAPRNLFPLALDAPRHLLLAGGIGITPILSMAERLHATGSEFHMHYCARSRERAAFVERIAAAPFASRASLHFDDGDDGQKLDIGARLAATEEGTHLYVCGPKGFIDAVFGAARDQRWDESRLHCEFFAAVAQPVESNLDFEVQIASTGRIVVVTAKQTIVEALAAEGIEIPFSCEQGVCGTCLTRVIEGIPDHRDLYLTPEEQALNDQLTPCCSRAKSQRLVLDI